MKVVAATDITRVGAREPQGHIATPTVPTTPPEDADGAEVPSTGSAW